MKYDTVPFIFSGFCFSPYRKRELGYHHSTYHDIPVVLKKITHSKDILRRTWKTRSLSEKPCQYWYHLHHKHRHTYEHTDDEEYRIGHRTFDLSCDGVDFFCLFCDLYEGLVELTSTLSGFDDRDLSISEASIVVSECFMHSTTSLDAVDHEVIELDHSFIFFLFFEGVETFEDCETRIDHRRHDTEKYHFLPECDRSSFEKYIFQIGKIGFLLHFCLTFLDIEDDEIGCGILSRHEK